MKGKRLSISVLAVSTAGVAGGLLSPKRALLLASLKGLSVDRTLNRMGTAPC
jgi:hypothetical protein